MYLWKLSVNDNGPSFEFSEHTPESGTKHNWVIARTYGIEDEHIASVITAAKTLAEKLEFNGGIRMIAGVDKIEVYSWCLAFEIIREKPEAKLKTNGWRLTRNQCNAIFDFVDVLSQNGWLF